MDEIFSQVDTWFSPDSILLMRVLISAMDKAHEKLHYQIDSIEFLNSRSKFYNIAMILVEGCSTLIQEKTEIPETNRQKMLSDLNDTNNQIQARLIELSDDIAMKDMEKLRQKQETEEREMTLITAKFQFENRVCEQSKKRFEPNLSEFVEKVIALRNDFVGLIVEETAAELPPPKPAIPTKLQRTTSEPTLEIRKEVKECEEDGDSDGSNYVAKMIKNHESIIRRQNRELKRLKGEILGGKVHQAFKRLKGTDDDGMERNLHQVIAHLDEIIAWHAEKMSKDSILIDQNRMELEQEREERDDSILKMLIMEDIHQLLLKDLVKDFQLRIEDHETHINESLQSIENMEMECFIKEEIYKVFCKEMIEKKNLDNFGNVIEEEIYNVVMIEAMKDIYNDKQSLEPVNRFSNCVNSSENIEIEYFIKEEIYKVFYREMIEERNLDNFGNVIEERNLDNFGNVIEEEIYNVVVIEAMKDIYNEKQSLEPVNRSPNCVNSSENIEIEYFIKDEIYKVFCREMIEERNQDNFGNVIEEEIYNVIMIEAMKDIYNEKQLLESYNKSPNCVNSSENIEIEYFIREEIYKVFYIEMMKEINLGNFGNTITEEIYNLVMIEVMKDIYDNKQEPDEFDKWLKDGLLKKVTSLVGSLKMGESLMCKASSEIEEHNTENEMVAMECDEAEDRDMIQWLLTGEESTFSSIRDKLEKSLQQLLQCKALLREFLLTLGHIDNRNKLFPLGKTNDEFLSLGAARRLLSLPLTGFKQTILEFETQACRKLEKNFNRLEELGQQVKCLVTYTTSLREKASLYEKAFFRRCQNLRIAETEVDMLGDQVDTLVGLIGKIYTTLDQHSSVLSCYVPVTEALKMIKNEMDSFAVNSES